MKEEHIDHIVGEFKDYKGEFHKFVIVALSQNLPNKVNDVAECLVEKYQDSHVSYEIETYVEDYGIWDYIGTVVKTVSLGISICNPTDEFDEEIGIKKALSRARKNSATLYSSNKGAINTPVVKALLQQEAKYLEENPGQFIKGYNESRDKYLLNKAMMEEYETFSSFEQEVISAIDENPKFMNKIEKYLKWLWNQRKGCQL